MTSQRAVTSSTSLRPASFARALFTIALCAPVGLFVRPAHAVDFVKPTAEELSMTSLPGFPGASAVILYREEVTKDDLHSVLHYQRIKVLTEEGKKYANVELPYFSSLSANFTTGDNKVLEDISGRTIHPDGTIIPFTGKPYLKVLEKANGYKFQEKIFTLPDVEVGSIIEYRYFTRISDDVVEAPTWMIQGDLYVKEAHFVWQPTYLTSADDDGKPNIAISWFPILPEGAKIEHHESPSASIGQSPTQTYELRVKNVPPRVKEEHMPPIGSFSYRVNFANTPYRSQQEYWQNTGKQLSKHINSFAGPNGALKDATAKVVAGASTPDEKLQKIYGVVMDVENTRFTREREKSEDKAAGMGQVNNAADILSHHRGTPTQITELFIGMARAAGLSAYGMWVPNREQELFVSSWMSTQQLDDLIAVVTVDGKDRFFDPGARYCPFGQLAWQHTLVQGVRQTDGGSALSGTPFEPYTSNRLTRIANLTLSSEGEVTGKVDLAFSGSPALRWRQEALSGDGESLRKQLREYAEEMLPRTLEIEVSDVKGVADYEKPFEVSYKVKGTVGNSMGKRTIVPADVFLVNHSATFPHEKRENAVYFDYPEITKDAVRITFPHELTIEAVPASAKYSLPKVGAYNLEITQAPNSVTTRREFALGDVLVMQKDYAGLRTFYSQLESKDQETVVLKAASPAAATASVTQPQ